MMVRITGYGFSSPAARQQSLLRQTRPYTTGVRAGTVVSSIDAQVPGRGGGLGKIYLGGTVKTVSRIPGYDFRVPATR